MKNKEPRFTNYGTPEVWKDIEERRKIKMKCKEQQSIIGMMTTNENPKIIKVDTDYDVDYRLLRVNIKINKKELYKIMNKWADDKQITRGILVSLKEKMEKEI